MSAPLDKPYKDDFCKELDAERNVSAGERGWLRLNVPRQGSEKKASDPYWFSPENLRFRSKKEIERYREAGWTAAGLTRTVFVGDAFVQKYEVGVTEDGAVSSGALTDDDIRVIRGGKGGSGAAVTPSGMGTGAAAGEGLTTALPKKAAVKASKEKETTGTGAGKSASGKIPASAAAAADGAAGGSTAGTKRSAKEAGLTGASGKAAASGTSDRPNAGAGGGGRKHPLPSPVPYPRLPECALVDDLQSGAQLGSDDDRQVVMELYQKKSLVGPLLITHVAGAKLHWALPAQLRVYQRTVLDAVREFGLVPFLQMHHRHDRVGEAWQRIAEPSSAEPSPFDGGQAMLCRVRKLLPADIEAALNAAAPGSGTAAAAAAAAAGAELDPGAAGGARGGAAARASPSLSQGCVKVLDEFLNTLRIKDRAGFIQTGDNNCQLYLLPGVQAGRPAGGADILAEMFRICRPKGADCDEDAAGAAAAGSAGGAAGLAAAGAAAGFPSGEDAYLLLILKNPGGTNLCFSPPLGDPACPHEGGDGFVPPKEAWQQIPQAGRLSTYAAGRGKGLLRPAPPPDVTSGTQQGQLQRAAGRTPAASANAAANEGKVAVVTDPVQPPPSSGADLGIASTNFSDDNPRPEGDPN